jgi:RNA polymerase sigma-70 factor (ECF subfamily)
MSNLATSADVMRLRAFAKTFLGRTEHNEADNLVAEALVQASKMPVLVGRAQSIKLFCIMYDNIRGYFSEWHGQPDRTTGDAEKIRFAEGLLRLPNRQREALILVTCTEFSYIEAADICGCAIGTIRSRVNRARHALAEALAA